MKLYNKLFDVFYLLLSVFSVTASESSDSVWEKISFEAPEQTSDLVKSLGDTMNMNVRVIVMDSITKYIRENYSDNFLEFNRKFGNISDLKSSADAVVNMLRDLGIVYYDLSYSDDKTKVFEATDDPQKISDYNAIMNKYITNIAKTEYGRNILITYCLSAFCCSPRHTLYVANKKNTLSVLSSKGDNDYIFLNIDLQQADLNYEHTNYYEIFISKDANLRLANLTTEKCLCHEFIHLIHHILKIHQHKIYFDDSCWIKKGFFKELFFNGFEAIKSSTCNLLNLIESKDDKTEFLNTLKRGIELIEQSKYADCFTSSDYFKILKSPENAESISDSFKDAFGEFIADNLLISQFGNYEEIWTILGLTVQDNTLYISDFYDAISADELLRFDHTGFADLDEEALRIFNSDLSPTTADIFVKKFIDDYSMVANKEIRLKTLVDECKFNTSHANVYKLNSPSKNASNFLIKLRSQENE